MQNCVHCRTLLLPTNDILPFTLERLCTQCNLKYVKMCLCSSSSSSWSSWGGASSSSSASSCTLENLKMKTLVTLTISQVRLFCIFSLIFSVLSFCFSLERQHRIYIWKELKMLQLAKIRFAMRSSSCETNVSVSVKERPSSSSSPSSRTLSMNNAWGSKKKSKVCNMLWKLHLCFSKCCWVSFEDVPTVAA